jgi:hypothetical protein
MLLTRTDSLPPVMGDGLSEQRGDVTNLYYLGGPGAVSYAVRDAVGAILE